MKLRERRLRCGAPVKARLISQHNHSTDSAQSLGCSFNRMKLASLVVRFFCRTRRNDRKGIGLTVTDETGMGLAMEAGQNAKDVWTLAERFCQN